MLSVRISFIVADFVYTAIGLQPAHYNELGKGLVEQSIEILDKLAEFYGLTIDQIVHLKKSSTQGCSHGR